MRLSDEDLAEAIAWRAKRDYRKDEGLDLLAMLDLRDALARVAELEAAVEKLEAERPVDDQMYDDVVAQLSAQAPVIEAAEKYRTAQRRHLGPWGISPAMAAAIHDLLNALDVLNPLDGKGE